MTAYWIVVKSVLPWGRGGSMAAAACNGLASGSKHIHTTALAGVGQDWRKKRGLPANPNAYGPLTDGPDYSYVDGRPTQPGSGKVERAVKQHDIATKIMELTGEIDFAVEYHKQRVTDSKERKRHLLEKKLKPKGLPDSD